MKLLEVNNLKSGYGKSTVIDDITFYVDKGECISIIGPNGAGKTTLFNTISGFVNYSGEIKFENKLLGSMKPFEIARLGISHCPEGRHILPQYNVLGNLTAGVLNTKNDYKIMDFCFSVFPILKERLRQKANTLSGGEQQMLAIARSLMTSPKFLMLDEPSMGLAPIVKKQIFSAIGEIRLKTTVLIVEQDASMIMPISDRIYVLEHGKITFHGTPEEITQNNELKKAYLGVE
ncbi:MAG: ABC transporter ATP-binding protein [Caldisericum exile]|uniref:ABC transporter ATP-binding protein n=1 Tax=Caldisericum exile TaxID=693075 RepID=A0A2J6X711_9BACT|nr:MAG: ABC transporter ATP-binding protein [Caldisericum exile]